MGFQRISSNSTDFQYFCCRFGRRPVIFVASLFLIGVRALQIFAPNIIVYSVARFFTALASLSIWSTSFVLLCELVGPKYRIYAGVVPHFLFSSYIASTIGVAYFIRDRFTLEMVLSIPFLILPVLCWFCPESPRWLCARQRHTEANIFLQKMAKQNGKHFQAKEVEIELEQLYEGHDVNVERRKETFSSLLKSRAMLFRAIILCMSW